jgi:transposase InsO family protein
VFIKDIPPQWLAGGRRYSNQVEIDFSRRGKPTDNAIVESFNGRFREE